MNKVQKQYPLASDWKVALPQIQAYLGRSVQEINRGADAYLFRVVSTTTSYNCHVGDSIIIVNADNLTITLPAADQTKEKRFTVKNGIGEPAVNNTTVTAVSGSIDGNADYVISVELESVDFVSDGTDYWIV